MGTRQSVTVDLDMRMPLEALILHRLQRLPVCRHEEWVRQLVLAGFRNECQTMKAEHVNGSFAGVDGHMKSFSMPHPVQSKDDSVPLSSASRAQAAETQTEIQSSPSYTPPENSSDNTSKPFAHLKRVMGDG